MPWRHQVRKPWMVHFLAVVMLACAAPAVHASDLTSVVNDETDFVLEEPKRELTESSEKCSCPDTSQEETQVLPMMISIPIIFVLVLMSGLFSGLTLGLMGLDIIGLEIVQKGENEELRKCAAKIAPVRKQGNMLLCTLLLGNVAVNSALSILTAEIASGFVGFFVSTALIVLFGEILPQAACSRYALQVGARTVPIVKLLMAMFYVITKPLSVLLDCLLGQEVGTVHSRTELMEMLKLQIHLGATDEESGKIAKQVAEGALCFRDKRVGDVMTPLNDAYMLSLETRLDYETIREIFEQGFSRVPVYGRDKHDYRGLLYTKDLMLADPEDEMKLGDFISIFNRKVESFFKSTKLVDVLNRFKKGGTHMGLVREANLDSATNPVVEICGVLTLEDVMEEILQEEIVDETDVYVDVDNHIRVTDGREKIKPNLGVFNPVWGSRNKDDRLSMEEVSAIASHLRTSAFTNESRTCLSMRATEWLVSVSAVQNRERVTPIGVDAAHESEDWLFRQGEDCDWCILVLQGRITMRVGREHFRCEAGAFSILGKDALCPGGHYVPDFSAHLSTMRARLLIIQKEKFLEAMLLDRTPSSLEDAFCQLAILNAGETSRRNPRHMPPSKQRGDSNLFSPRSDTSTPFPPKTRHGAHDDLGAARLAMSPPPAPTCGSTRTPTVETGRSDETSVSL
mmetsp:Transcript_44986/g.104092  ORF Transcript_44986/g.104092 Transcript_44986/m.104092 type:complete len:683 (+) Transcript_44986:93-2141(+)